MHFKYSKEKRKKTSLLLHVAKNECKWLWNENRSIEKLFCCTENSKVIQKTHNGHQTNKHRYTQTLSRDFSCRFDLKIAIEESMSWLKAFLMIKIRQKSENRPLIFIRNWRPSMKGKIEPKTKIIGLFLCCRFVTFYFLWSIETMLRRRKIREKKEIVNKISRFKDIRFFIVACHHSLH